MEKFMLIVREDLKKISQFTAQEDISAPEFRFSESTLNDQQLCRWAMSHGLRT